jgi:hypothetical protein
MPVGTSGVSDQKSTAAANAALPAGMVATATANADATASNALFSSQ